jgi:hypothetical protein
MAKKQPGPKPSPPPSKVLSDSKKPTLTGPKKLRASATRVFGFVKLFDKLEYANSFAAGQLRLHTLEFFRNYRDSNGELRGDPYEGVKTILQPSRVTLRVGDHLIDSSDLAGPIRLRTDLESSWNVLCFYALTNAGIEDRTFSSLEEMKEAIHLHEDCFGLGKYAATITNGQKFINRFERRVHAMGLTYSRRLVSYYDESSFHGEFSDAETPFKKRIRFAHQKEYRFAVDTGLKRPEPLVLEVGDLSDICQVMTTEEFNKNFQVVPKEAKKRSVARKGRKKRTERP